MSSAPARDLVPRLKRLLVESLKLEGLEPGSIGDEQPLFGGDLGLDSVDALELVVAIEREFGVAMPSEEVGGDAFSNVAALAGWIARELAREGAPRP
ncbi:MAG: acyl carrier protein [Holophagales bacterium]|nr:acyl carrier protein [Holophagales bacterium]